MKLPNLQRWRRGLRWRGFVAGVIYFGLMLWLAGILRLGEILTGILIIVPFLLVILCESIRQIIIRVGRKWALLDQWEKRCAKSQWRNADSEWFEQRKSPIDVAKIREARERRSQTAYPKLP